MTQKLNQKPTKQLSAKDRVILEKNDLCKKLLKLEQFLVSENFKLLSSKMRSLLQDQYDIMAAYIRILDARLAIWED